MSHLLGNSIAIGRKRPAITQQLVFRIKETGNGLVISVPLMPTTVGGDIPPLQDDQIAHQIRGKLELVTKVGIATLILKREFHDRNVGPVGVIGIGGTAVDFVRNEGEWMGIEAFLSGDLSRTDGAALVLEVALVMSGQDDFQVDDRAGLVAGLDDRGERSSEDVLGVIVVAVLDETADGESAAEIEAVGTAFGGWIGGRSAPPDGVDGGVVVARARGL